jgi:hypothetical protein
LGGSSCCGPQGTGGLWGPRITLLPDFSCAVVKGGQASDTFASLYGITPPGRDFFGQVWKTTCP